MCAELTPGFNFVEVQRLASSGITTKELVQVNNLHIPALLSCLSVCLSCDSSHCSCKDKAEQVMLLQFYFQLILLKSLQAKDCCPS